MSSAFPCLGSDVAKMHQGVTAKHIADAYPADCLIANHADTTIVDAMAAACRLHANPQAVMLMLVLPDERNIADQRKLEFLLFEKHGIKTIRKSLNQLGTRATLSAARDLVMCVCFFSLESIW